MAHPQTNGQINGHMNGVTKPSAADFRPTAAYDFRSDTLTSPTKAMLDAIYQTTYYDDAYGEDPTTNNLEASIAELTGKEAGLLVMSGTMGNQVAIRTHLTTPPHSVICDIRSHIANYEAGGMATISGAMPICISPANSRHLTLEDIKRHAVISDDPHMCPTKLICLENTLHGTIMPIDEMRRISLWAKENGMKVHMDGARIWEAAAAGAGRLDDFCSLVDTASLCFSKGLGAPLGSMVIGPKEFIRQARRIRKMLGGGGRQSGLISAAAVVAVQHGFGSGKNGEGGHLRACHQRATKVAESWTARGGKLQYPVETNMVWLDLKSAGLDADKIAKLAKKENITINGGRIVCHYQIAEEALEGLERVFEAAIGPKTSER